MLSSERPAERRHDAEPATACSPLVHGGLFDIAIPLFETEDFTANFGAAIEAIKAGQPRPVFEFHGR